jgi:hypothetical protein
VESTAKSLTRLCVLALAVTIAAPELHAEEAPLPAPTPAPEPARDPLADARLTRLFFAPTARSLPRGRGSVGVTEVLFPSVEVGLTNHVSVGGIGVLPLEDLSAGGLALASKVQLYGGARIQAAVGVVQLFSSQGDSGGIGYGVVTLGSADVAVTVGYAYGYGGLADSGGSPSIRFLGAEKALGRHVRLIGEGYIGGAALGMPDRTLLGGLRVSRGRWSADLGVIVPFYETGSGSPFPVLTVAWAF